MAYILQIDLNPGDNQETDHEIDLKANNDTDAIVESRTVLESGDYLPYGDDDSPNEEMEIIGTVINGSRNVATVTTAFPNMTPKETTVEGN